MPNKDNDKALSIQSLLRQAADLSPQNSSFFFKTGPGEYAAHDQFLGVSVPIVRKIAKDFFTLPLKDLKILIQSPINEERLTALLILVNQYRKGTTPLKNDIYQFYINHIQYVNNWNLVDTSAHLIMGAYLHEQADKSVLLNLAASDNLWERRISIVSTWYFIRHHDLDWTLTLAERLLYDPHDLIHKAVGWMLRELGKRDQSILTTFLDRCASHMPRTMLRYAIEKFPNEQRKGYLTRRKIDPNASL